MDYDSLDRRTYLTATVATLVTGASGCVDLDLEKRGRPTEATVEELLDDPGQYEDDTVRTSGHARYTGERTYMVPMFDPATEMVRPQPVTEPTYELAAEPGDEETIPVHASAIHPELDDLDVDTWYENTVTVAGDITEAETDGTSESVYLIEDASIGPSQG